MKGRLVVATADSSSVPRGPLAALLARALQRRAWQVIACDVVRDVDHGVARLLAAVRRALSATPGQSKPIVVLLGSEAHQRRFAWALASLGLLPALKVVLHVRAAAVPLDSAFAPPLSFAELVVTESAFGTRAVEACALDGGVRLRRPPATIPPAIEPYAVGADFASRRDTARRELFGIGRDQLLIGCHATSPGGPQPFLTMQVFRTLVDGLYWSCAHCGGFTLFPTDDGLRPVAISACGRCGVAEGRRGIVWPSARLFVADHRARPPAPFERALGRWTPGEMRRALGLEGRVLLGGDLLPADSDETMIERVACLDIHLLPHHLADVESVLLASCAMGVPAVTTDFGSARELLGGAARLVAPAVTLDDSAGHQVAIMDVGEGTRELLRLAQDPQVRAELGQSARAAMTTHHEVVVIPQWVDHLERLAAA